MPESERDALAAKAESVANAAMIDEETGLRGYLLTHEIAFLGPYASGVIALARANDAVSANVGSVATLSVPMLGRLRVLDFSSCR